MYRVGVMMQDNWPATNRPHCGSWFRQDIALVFLVGRAAYQGGIRRDFTARFALSGPESSGKLRRGSDGYILTCAHVLGDKKEATITLDGTRVHADVIRSDAKADLALLKLRDKLPESATVLTFRDRAHAYSMGEDVFTIGYPLSRLLGNSARMTKGLLSATTGLRDDPNQIQVSAEIQPGNSGGPLLDHDGHILGVIEQTMNPWRVAQATGGALPQNINFAIKNDPILDFLKLANPDMSAKLRFDQASSLEKAVHVVAKKGKPGSSMTPITAIKWSCGSFMPAGGICGIGSLDLWSPPSTTTAGNRCLPQAKVTTI